MWENSIPTKKETAIIKRLKADKSFVSFNSKQLTQLLTHSIYLLSIQQLCLLNQRPLAKEEEQGLEYHVEKEEKVY